MNIEEAEKREMQVKQRRVAGLFVLALVLAMIFAYWMGAFGIGASKHVYVYFNFAGGIERGSTVRLAGIKVGRVADLSFVKEGLPEGFEQSKESPENIPSLPDSTHLKMKIEVTGEAFKQITSDSRFYINLAGLIGERYVEVVPGQGNSVSKGEIFRGVDPPRVDQLLSQGYGIFGDLRDFFKENKSDLKEMLTTLNDLSKNLAKVMGGFTPSQKKEISQLISNLSSASGDLRELASSLNSGATYIGSNGGRESWQRVKSLIERGDKFGLQEIRRLMLEDGVKVNFSSRRVPDLNDSTKREE